MLVVEVNRENLEYDVNSLVRAFYPEEQVRVLTPETSTAKRAELTDDIGMTIGLEEENGVITIGNRSFSWQTVNGETQNKDSFKRFLYRTLAEVTGKQLP